MLKFDLSDGYYRVPLSPQAALELAVLLPGKVKGQHLIGLPLTLPMGWALSPPYFCAYTETAADLANHALAMNLPCAHPDPVETTSQALKLPLLNTHSSNAVVPMGPLLPEPLSYVDVYLDDFIALAQHNAMPPTLHHLVASIHQVFRASPHRDDPLHRTPIINANKMAKGEASWSTEKVILGWHINTATRTLHLPLHKQHHLHALLQSFLPKRRTSRQWWQSLLGELRHMATAIRGARYLFSILQSVLTDQPTSPRVRLSTLVHATLNDWLYLCTSLASAPVPIASLVPRSPNFVGAVDASQHGYGGFWLANHAGSIRPTVFRAPFPDFVQAHLATSTNPAGALSNSDLELAGMVASLGVLQSIHSQPSTMAYIGSDNTPAVMWCAKGSSSSTKARAFLLRLLANLCHTKDVTLHPIYVAGNTNTLADFCSRSFHLQDEAFLAHINDTFPITPPWQLARLPNALASAVTSALLRIPSPWESVSPATQPLTVPSTSGSASAPPLVNHPHWTPSSTPFRSFKSSLIGTEWANFLPAGLKSAVERWATPFVPLARRWPSWDTPTLASSLVGN
jgi:hypothetical protein